MNLFLQILFLVLAYAIIADSRHILPLTVQIQEREGYMNTPLNDGVESSVEKVFKHLILKRDVNTTVVQTPILLSEDSPTSKKTTKKDLEKQDEIISSHEILPPNTNISASNASSENKIAPLVINNNATVTENVTHEVTENNNEQKSGAQKRGLIVFGSLGLISFFYVVYKYNKRQKQLRDNSITFDSNDQQFKYGILTSNDHGDSLEMSNIPLTAESDDEDELEIFDLEGRRRFEMNNTKNDNNVNNRLLEKEDVEILDLDLPGVKNTSHLNSGTIVDDDLLNLDDAIDEILSKPVIQNNFTSNTKNTNNDNLFDVL